MNQRSDALRRFVEALPAAVQTEVLRAGVEAAVRSVLERSATAWVSDEHVADAVRDRLEALRGDEFVSTLVGMARDRDPDVEQWLFPDGREECLVATDEELKAVGEDWLDRYLDYRDNYPEYDAIDPSDYVMPREDDPDAERKRLVGLFTDLAREWRDQFLRGLAAEF